MNWIAIFLCVGVSANCAAAGQRKPSAANNSKLTQPKVHTMPLVVLPSGNAFDDAEFEEQFVQIVVDNLALEDGEECLRTIFATHQHESAKFECFFATSGQSKCKRILPVQATCLRALVTQWAWPKGPPDTKGSIEIRKLEAAEKGEKVRVIQLPLTKSQNRVFY